MFLTGRLCRFPCLVQVCCPLTRKVRKYHRSADCIVSRAYTSELTDTLLDFVHPTTRFPCLSVGTIRFISLCSHPTEQLFRHRRRLRPYLFLSFAHTYILHHRSVKCKSMFRIWCFCEQSLDDFPPKLVQSIEFLPVRRCDKSHFTV
jgi:hypothetical protein